MSPTMPNRPPNKSRIPRGFILNWQSSKNQGATPLIRRPITACEACRAAKVKCNAQKDCQRCSNRGIECVYVAPSNSSDAKSQQHGRSPPRSRQSSAHEFSPDIPTDLEINGPDLSMPDGMELDLGELAAWPQEVTEQFPWLTPDLNFQNTTLRSPTHLDPAGWDFSQLSSAYPPFQYPTPASSETYNGLHESPNGNFTAKTSSNNHSSQKELTFDNCQCRSRLSLYIPKITFIMEEKPAPKLDEVFKVTRAVIQSCQDMIDCTRCQITCSDLLCILVVFQHTDACFGHIAKADLSHPVTISIGQYKVTVTNDTTPRQMLVMDLGRQANTLLDSIASVEQRLSSSPCAANRLNEANGEYLRKVKDAFRTNLQLVIDSVDAATSKPGKSGEEV
ncbi:hypothetical protein CJF30_00003814 [Rutstroemia sp. NJR-2017a BBW]|nr:hypothetical protein CJF30_00003814 [Rutstroemia sp. NJR-2017a BBW]